MQHPILSILSVDHRPPRSKSGRCGGLPHHFARQPRGGRREPTKSAPGGRTAGQCSFAGEERWLMGEKDGLNGF